MKSKWSVVALYGGSSAREAAVSFCKTLAERFWTRFDFEVSSWSFQALEETSTRELVACTAESADLILVSVTPGQDLPRHVRAWIETWMPRRHEREGVLAVLGSQEKLSEMRAHGYLLQVAHQAGMDFLTGVPEHIHDPFSDSAEVYTARAKQVTTTLGGILNQPSSPHLG